MIAARRANDHFPAAPRYADDHPLSARCDVGISAQPRKVHVSRARALALATIAQGLLRWKIALGLYLHDIAAELSRCHGEHPPKSH